MHLAHDSIESVVRTMLANEIRHLPLVAEGAVVTVVSARDVLSALIPHDGQATSES